VLINSTLWEAISVRWPHCRRAKSHNQSTLQPIGYIDDFGDPLAGRRCDAQQGKSREGEQNGQENFEEGEEAGSNQAVNRNEVGWSLSFIVRSAAIQTTRPENSISNVERGRRHDRSGPVRENANPLGTIIQRRRLGYGEECEASKGQENRKREAADEAR